MKFCMSEPITHMSDLNCHAEFTCKIETFAVNCTAKRQVVKWEVNKLAVTKLGTFSVLCITEIFRLFYLFHLLIVFISFCFPPRTPLLKIHLTIILVLSYTFFFFFFIKTSTFGAEAERSFFAIWGWKRSWDVLKFAWYTVFNKSRWMWPGNLPLTLIILCITWWL